MRKCLSKATTLLCHWYCVYPLASRLSLPLPFPMVRVVNYFCLGSWPESARLASGILQPRALVSFLPRVWPAPPTGGPESEF